MGTLKSLACGSAGRFLLLFLFLSIPLNLSAQLLPATATQDEKQEQEPEWPEDQLGRRTPKSSIAGFIAAVADDNYEKASRYFNLDDVPGNVDGAQLAKVLETLLDQQGQVLPYSWISDKFGGKIDDDLPPNIEQVGEFYVDDEKVNLLLEEVKGAEGGPLWLISSETVERLAVLDPEEIVLPVERIIPEFASSYSWGGAPAAQWLITLLLAGLAYLIAWGLVWLLLKILPWMWKKAGEEPHLGIAKAFALPLQLYLAVLLFAEFTQNIGISIIIRQEFSGLSLIIGMIAFLILLWRLTGFVSTFSTGKMKERENASGVSVVLFLTRAAKIAIVVFAIIAILGTFGFDVTTGLAALGIGGIALALGAQKTVENFVGSVTVITDQPVRVGDFCKVGSVIGTVEKIGMRSTRIRTLGRTIVTIPNGEFASSQIENYAHRDQFWFNPVISLRYETTPDQIRFLLVELRSVLYAHPLVSPDPARIRFINLGSASLNLEVFAYITVSTYDDYLEVQEDLLLRMMDVVGESGTGFAFPSQTIYLSRDKGLSEEKSEAAESRVRKWREKGEMPIPKFTPEEIEKIKDSIHYPPEGSSNAKATGTGKIPGL